MSISLITPTQILIFWISVILLSHNAFMIRRQYIVAFAQRIETIFQLTEGF